MSLELVTCGDAFVDLIIGPLAPIRLTGQIRATIGQTEVVTSEAVVFGGKIAARRLNLAESVEKYGGGSSANSAFAAARLGASSGIFSRVGRDENGVFVVDSLRDMGVDVSRIIVDNRMSTGVSTILLAHDGTRASLTYPGACGNLSPDDVDVAYLKKAKVVHITNCFLLPRIVGAPLVEIARKIKELRLVLSLDPGPIPLTYEEDKVEALIPSLRFVDIFQATIDEARCISGLYAPSAIAERLLDNGIDTVVLKMGDKGSLVADKHTRTAIPPFRVKKVIDTTGAGDIYAAAMLTELAKGVNIVEAAHFASAAASLKIMRGKGREGYPTRAEVEERLRR